MTDSTRCFLWVGDKDSTNTTLPDWAYNQEVFGVMGVDEARLVAVMTADEKIHKSVTSVMAHQITRC